MAKLALVSGAAGGLGKSMALACAARGYDLCLTDLREDRLESLAAGIRRQYPVKITCLACDLTDPSAVEALWNEIGRLGLEFSMLVNVAGLDYEGQFMQIDAALLNQIVQLNIASVISMIHHVLRHRERAEKLHIINVASLAAFYPMPVKAVYAASKRFLLNLSLALDEELAGDNVHVTALCPAGMPTNESCVRSILAQGWAGAATTIGTGTVAERCLSKALSGCKVYIPGFVNLGLRFASLILPQVLLARVIFRRWCDVR